MHKKYLDENKLINTKDMKDALEAAIAKEKSEGNDWIKKMLEQKKNARNCSYQV